MMLISEMTKVTQYYFGVKFEMLVMVRFQYCKKLSWQIIQKIIAKYEENQKQFQEVCCSLRCEINSEDFYFLGFEL